MKYIRFKNIWFVIFNRVNSHKEIASLIKDEVMSAWFITTDDKLYWEGISLNKRIWKTDQEDFNNRFEKY